MAIKAISNIENNTDSTSNNAVNPMYMVFKAMADAADVQTKVLDPLFAANQEYYDQYAALQVELKELIAQLKNKENVLNQLKDKWSDKKSKIDYSELTSQQSEINDLQMAITEKRSNIEMVRGKMEVLWQSTMQEAKESIANMITMAGIFLERYNRQALTTIRKI